MVSRRGRGGRAFEGPSNNTGDMAVNQAWVPIENVSQRKEFPDLEDELAQLEGVLPMNKDIAPGERVVNITPEVVDNRPDPSNITESGLSLDEQLQLARSAKEQLLKQKELENIRADIKDLHKGVEPKSVRGRSKQHRPHSNSGDVNQRRDRSSSGGKDNYSIKPDSLDFYYGKNCKEHQEWT